MPGLSKEEFIPCYFFSTLNAPLFHYRLWSAESGRIAVRDMVGGDVHGGGDCVSGKLRE